MLTEAIIMSIDYTSNTCVVRMPYFERAGVDRIITATAHIACPPGVYNGYKVGDAVFIGFDLDRADLPIILGKIFTGTQAFKQDNGGTLQATNLDVSIDATLPIGTRFLVNKDYNYSDYDSIIKMITTLRDYDQHKLLHENGYYLSLKLGRAGHQGTYHIIAQVTKQYAETTEGFNAFIASLTNAGISSEHPLPVTSNSDIYCIYATSGKLYGILKGSGETTELTAGTGNAWIACYKNYDI